MPTLPPTSSLVSYPVPSLVQYSVTVPALVWFLPLYVPPPQKSSKNRIGISRSLQVTKLRDQLGWAAKAKEVYWDGRAPAGKRLVIIESWKKGVLYDHGNYVQACKALLDSLKPDVLLDDAYHACVDFYAQHHTTPKGHPIGTLVRVYDIQGEISRGPVCASLL